MLDKNLVEELAAVIGAMPGLIEKDWHAVRAINVLASLDYADVTPVFSGGTSLSKGWGLIKRFSEDIDFKVISPSATSASASRNHLRSYREKILEALTANNFRLAGEPLVGNESRFFSADLNYPSLFAAGQGLRPHLRVEMSFHTTALPPINRPLQSLMSQAQEQLPEVPSFPCVDPIETAADKLSALGWRVCTRKRGERGDDPAVVRHIYDLAALERHIGSASEFAALVRQIAEMDTGRGGGGAPLKAVDRFETMLELLQNDAEWAQEYEEYVLQVSFAGAGERISFDEALTAAKRLVISVLKEERI